MIRPSLLVGSMSRIASASGIFMHPGTWLGITARHRRSGHCRGYSARDPDRKVAPCRGASTIAPECLRPTVPINSCIGTSACLAVHSAAVQRIRSPRSRPALPRPSGAWACLASMTSPNSLHHLMTRQSGWSIMSARSTSRACRSVRGQAEPAPSIDGCQQFGAAASLTLR